MTQELEKLEQHCARFKELAANTIINNGKIDIITLLTSKENTNCVESIEYEPYKHYCKGIVTYKDLNGKSKKNESGVVYSLKPSSLKANHINFLKKSLCNIDDITNDDFINIASCYYENLQYHVLRIIVDHAYQYNNGSYISRRDDAIDLICQERSNYLFILCSESNSFIDNLDNIKKIKVLKSTLIGKLLDNTDDIVVLYTGNIQFLNYNKCIFSIDRLFEFPIRNFFVADCYENIMGLKEYYDYTNRLNTKSDIQYSIIEPIKFKDGLNFEMQIYYNHELRLYSVGLILDFGLCLLP